MVENYGEKRAKNYRIAQHRRTLNKEIKSKCVMLSNYCLGELDEDFVERLSSMEDKAVALVENEYLSLHQFHRLAWDVMKHLIAYRDGTLTIEDCPETPEAIQEAEAETRRLQQKTEHTNENPLHEGASWLPRPCKR